MNINRRYIVDEMNHRIAVQLDIETFEKIEEAMENFSLVSLMKDSESQTDLDLEEAKLVYADLEKAS